MDNKLSNIIKKEKEEIFEDNDDFSNLCFDIGIKVETDHDIDDWSIQKVLSDYQEVKIYQKLERDDTQICVVCNIYFPDSHSLSKHNLIHLTVPLIKLKFYMCDLCPKFYTKKNFLKNHIITKHQPKKRYEGVMGPTKSQHTCKICNKTYSYKSWHDHQRTVHGGGKWKCEPCDVKFKCERYLKRHNKFIHEGVRPAWRYHSVKSEESWECSKCPSILKNKSSLKTHMRNCHSEKTFQCKICKSILKSEPYLRTHMLRVHYDDGMVHSCNICGKIFKSPRYVKVHIINSHSSKTKKIFK